MSSVPPPPTPPEPVPPAPQPPVPTPTTVPPVPTPMPTPVPPVATPAPAEPGPAAQYSPPPAAPSASGSSSKLGIIVVLGIIVTLVVLAGALFALFSTLSNSIGDDDAGGGEPPVVVDGPPCDGCLTLDDALGLRMPDGVPTLGLAFDDEAGYSKPSVIGTYADGSAETYETGDGSPVGCSFAIDYSPVSPTNPGTDNRTDRVGDLGSYDNDTDYLSMVTRVFESEADAASYPDSLRDGLAACPHYSFWFSDGEDSWETDVTPIDVPTSSPAVTAVGWQESDNGSNLTIVDLQYANLTVRTVFSRTDDSVTTDEQFRAFVLELSSSLEALNR